MSRPMNDAFEPIRLMGKHKPRMSKRMKWKVKGRTLKVSLGLMATESPSSLVGSCKQWFTRGLLNNIGGSTSTLFTGIHAFPIHMRVINTTFFEGVVRCGG